MYEILLPFKIKYNYICCVALISHLLVWQL